MRSQIEEALSLLGKPVKDRVTGFAGTVVTIGFDLTGCIQAVVADRPKKGSEAKQLWFDVKRLDVKAVKAVIKQPDFVSVPGGISKSVPKGMPLP